MKKSKAVSERIVKLTQKALEMVELWTKGERILAAGFIFTPNSNFSMSLSDAAECREILRLKGILMERIDSGGSPEWGFRVIKRLAL